MAHEKKTLAPFIVVWAGQLISSLGSGLTAFALGVYAFEKTKSASVYSLIILCAFLPSYLLKPIGGTLADRINRKWLIVAGDLGSALGLLPIAISLYSGTCEMWLIYLGTALSGAFGAFHNPAYKASVSDLLSVQFYAKASGLIQLADSSKFILSPILAGFLLHFTSIEWVLAIDVATYLLAGMAAFSVKLKSASANDSISKEPFFKDFFEGFRIAFANKALIYLLCLISLITFAVGFMQALMGPMILAFTDAKTLGTIQTTSASGMLLGSLFIGLFSKTNHQAKTLSIALFFTGMFYALVGTFTQISLLILFGFLFFLCLPFVNTSLEVRIRLLVDNRAQGRLWSIVSLISQMGMLLAFAISGVLADKVFNPLLLPGGMLSDSIGKIIGTGEGRGIGLMFLLAGSLVSITAFSIKKLSKNGTLTA